MRLVPAVHILSGLEGFLQTPAIPAAVTSRNRQPGPIGYSPDMNGSSPGTRDPGTCRVRHAITILIYDCGMPVSVNVLTVHPRKLAAVRREVAPDAIETTVVHLLK